MSANPETVAGLIAEGQDRYIVPGLERGLRLLAEFNARDRVLSAADLSRRLDVPRSTVFRLLATLEATGYVERADGGREYRLGLAVLRLGFDYLASLELTELGGPLLNRLRDDIEYPCNLVVRDGRSVVYVAKAAASRPFASNINVGARLPAHATVLGHVLLEDMELEPLRELYPEPQLQVYSDSTPRTVEALHELVQQVRQQGYVLHEGFFEASISTIAAPVRDRTGKVAAALGATIPASRLPQEELDRMVEKVRETAGELSRLLGYRPHRLARSGQGKVVPMYRD
ncbi:IclR family transcriptional regulator [Cupriavidus pauculus]|uniref:IclR family transcriptional regulator n=1 Tax=Cupriavidus pauculus TaxID=82633 RepID=UPI001EE33076|nr:IclR family transcriptional regulator [Cupriavidus pauculus]GJG94936.1 IclR family transcriptional regulator [Cupriavidus pauculus]